MAATLIAAGVGACRTPEQPTPTSESTDTTDEVGTDPDQPSRDAARRRELLARAAAHSADHGGLSMLVRHDGEVVFEQYEQGTTADDAHNLFSGTKSFNCAVAVAAAEDGLLALDEPVATTLVEWQDDPDLAAITVTDLLSLSSGLEGGEQADIVSYEDAVARAAMKVPGERGFDYGPDPFQIFGAFMSSKLGGDDEAVLSFLRRRVFEPIGLEYALWRTEPAGQPRLSAGAFLTAEDWSRYGQLLIDGGRWGDRTVLDPDLLPTCFDSGAANPNYGLTFWLPTREGGFASGGLPSTSAERCAEIGCPDDLAKAAGVGGQALYLIPSMGLVVVRQTAGPTDPATDGFSEAAFLGPVLDAFRTG